jgi:hypothetical protein
MSHPFESISPHRLHTAFWLLAATTAILLTVEGTIYVKLTNPVAPLGILSLELAATPDRLNQVVGSWAEGPKSGMIFSLGLNFLCLFALTNTIAVACVIAAKRLNGPFSRLGSLLAWAQWLAGAVWAVQNSLLAWGVFGHASWPTTALSASLSIAKFTIVGMGVLYAVTAALLGLARPRPLPARQEAR